MSNEPISCEVLLNPSAHPLEAKLYKSKIQEENKSKPQNPHIN